MERTRRRLRSSTVILGSMGALAAALTSCGSEPDKRCVDPASYDVAKGYRIVDSAACGSNTSGGQRIDGDWYYEADVEKGWADYGTFDKDAVDRGGFGCSGSGSGGG